MCFILSHIGKHVKKDRVAKPIYWAVVFIFYSFNIQLLYFYMVSEQPDLGSAHPFAVPKFGPRICALPNLL